LRLHYLPFFRHVPTILVSVTLNLTISFPFSNAFIS
jgi:hypothetical protein